MVSDKLNQKLISQLKSYFNKKLKTATKNLATQVKISDLPAGGAITGTEQFEVNKSGVSVSQTAQQIKDFINVSSTSSYGEIFFNGNEDETFISAINTPEIIEGTYLNGELSGFTHAVNSGVLVYTGPPATFLVILNTSVTYDGDNAKTTQYIAYNGSVITNSKQSIDLFGVSPSLTKNVIVKIVNLNTNDQLSAFTENNAGGSSTGTENIVHGDLSLIAVELTSSSSSADVDLQQAWENSINGDIILNAGGKTYSIKRSDGTTKLVEYSENGSQFISDSVFPFRINSLPGGTEPEVYIKWDNSTTQGSAGQIRFTSMTDEPSPIEYVTFRLNVIANNKTPGSRHSTITFETVDDEVGTKYPLTFSGDNKTVELGDTLVLMPLNNAQIAARNKVDSMLYWSSESRRQQYHDASTNSEKQIATLDDINTASSVMYAQTSTGNVANTTTEQSLVTSGAGSFSIPANTLTVGDSFILRLYGSRRRNLSAPPGDSLNIRVKSNSSTLFSHNTLLSGTQTLSPFFIEFIMTVRAVGAAGTAVLEASAYSPNLFSAEYNGNFSNNTTFDTTVNNSLDLTAQFNIASVNNQIQSRILTFNQI